MELKVGKAIAKDSPERRGVTRDDKVDHDEDNLVTRGQLRGDKQGGRGGGERGGRGGGGRYGGKDYVEDFVMGLDDHEMGRDGGHRFMRLRWLQEQIQAQIQVMACFC